MLVHYPAAKAGTAYAVPDTVTAIGDSAFDHNQNLQSITLTENVTQIGSCSFWRCDALTGFTIPQNVTIIGDSPFANCSLVTDITVEVGNTAFQSIDGVLFDIGGTSLIQCPAGKTGGYTVPDGVTSIKSGAFRGCTQLTSVSLCDDVTDIESCAFAYCDGLTSVDLGSSVQKLGYGAFQCCSGLKSVMLPASVANLDNNVFDGCGALRDACFMGNAPAAGTDIFSNCADGLTIYHTDAATGFTNPWNGYTTAVFNPSVTLTVSFDLNGASGTAPDSQTVYEGVKLVCPADPTNGEKYFGGWYTEATCENEWDFDTAVTSDSTLFALWKDFIGSGTEDDPYQVSTPEQLNAVRYYPDAHFIMTNDIDMTEATSSGGKYWYNGEGWLPIGNYSKPFTGIFDGNGNKITGVLIERTDLSGAGLFGHVIGSNAIVKNLTLEDCSITAKFLVGGIVGYLKGNVINCHFNGKVLAILYRAGGIVGEVTGASLIDLCSNTGRIDSQAHAGGIAGVVDGSCALSRCYNSGRPSSSDYSGGIAAYINSGEVRNCYNVGYIAGYAHMGGITGYLSRTSSIKNCYSAGYMNGSLNNPATGDSEGTVINYYGLSHPTGSGITLEQMRHQETFIGFDFDAMWEMGEGERFPHLRNMPYVFTNGVNIDRDTLYLDFTGSITLHAVFNPDSATNKNIIWTSSDPSIARVFDGEVTAVSEGTTQITLTSLDGGFSDICNVVVSNDPVNISIPDANLKNVLLQKGTDKNKDGELTESEMNAIQGKLDLNGKGVTDLTGLEYAKRLSILDISNNNIKDISALSRLGQLVELDISGNPISDIFSLTELTKLKVLAISGNPISDMTPVSSLVNLTNLEMNHSNVSNLNFISNLVNLEVLIAQGSNLTTLDGIENLEKLRSLQLRFNKIDDISAISGLKSLTYVDLLSNQIKDLSAFSELLSIKYLHLDDNQIKDLSSLSKLQNLIELSLDQNISLNINTMPSFGMLEYLDIFGDNILDISSLSSLPNLTHLSASSNRIKDLSPLASLNKLTIVYLGSNDISDISPIAGLQSLQSIDLQNNKITDITPFASRTNITSLYINYNYIDITNTSPQKAVIDTLKAKKTNVYYSTQYTDLINFNDPGLRQGLLDGGVDKDCSGNITLGEIYFFDGHLDLSGRHITDLTGLENAFTLTWLDLSDNSLKNANQLATLYHLKYLDISNNMISDMGFVYDYSLISEIRTLKMKGNKVKSIASIEEVPWLTDFDMSGNLITDITPLLNSEHLENVDVSYNYLDISASSTQLAAINALQKDSIDVTYKPQYSQVTGVQLLNKAANIYTNDTIKLKAVVQLPTDCVGNTTVSWSSANNNVATINSEGIVKAIAPGTVEIIVTTEDGGFCDTCLITVSLRQVTVSASPNNTAYGSVSGSGTYNIGDNVALSANANPGHRFVRWLQNDTEISRDPVYSFTAQNDSSFTAEFAALPPVHISFTKRDVTAYGGSDGSISLSGSGGTSGAYQFSIDGGTSWGGGYFSGLSAGSYMALVRDANYPSLTASCTVSIAQPAYIGSVPANKIASKASVSTAVTVIPPAAPRGYTTVSVTYSSTNPSVATVDAKGNMTFLAGGKATIITKTVSQTVDKKGRVKTKVTTIKKAITVIQPVQSISLNMANATVARTQKIKLAASFNPATATNKKVKWISSNPKVAAVSSSGVVTGKAGGTAVITCRAQDGSNVSASCTVTVTPVYPSGVKLSRPSLTLKLSKTATLKATITPKNTDFKTITWSSSNPAVVTVDAKGKIKALSSGAVTITAATSNGLSASCMVTVP